MTIAEWLERNRLTHEEFALICGCDRSTVTKWITGERAPSPKWAKILLRKTKGQVDFGPSVSVRIQNKMVSMSLYRQGLTISAAAEKLRIHRNTLARFLAGKSNPPDQIRNRILSLAGLK